jgi:hypothetical protein
MQTLSQPSTFPEQTRPPKKGLTFVGAIFVFLLTTCTGGALRAEPILHHLFSDHMVLQRDEEIPVWGWAVPGEPISVSLAGNMRETVADPQGRWRVTLPAEQAGGPFALLVKGQRTIALRDVLVGEVWVASGQSNMSYALSGATDGNQAGAKANYPGIRFFTIPRKTALAPQQDTLPALREPCTPESALKFSAYDSAHVDGNQIRIHFQSTGSGLETRGETLKGFAIAGADRKFHWAEAHIEGESVMASSESVPHPVAVRYAWADSPECNLFNKEGLPASPFRTDDWPGASTGKR